MAVYIRNSTNRRLYFAMAIPDQNCFGMMKFRKFGWKILEPGTTKWMWGKRDYNTKNKPFFWYAEEVGGNLIWGGPHYTHMPHTVFDRCWEDTSTNGRLIGMRMAITPSSGDDYYHPIYE